MNNPYLSIIVPAYNEETSIAQRIRTLEDHFSKKDFTFEIIVIDDGSLDQTLERIAPLKNECVVSLEHVQNRGKGAAVRTGMQAAQGSYRIFLDADNQISIIYLDSVLKKLEEGADIVIASAHIPFTRKQLFQYRYYLGNAAKWLIKIIMNWNFWDTQRGLKGFTAAAAQALFSRQTIERWGFDIELLAIARAHGLKVAQVPITYELSGVTRVSPWSYVATFFDLLRIKVHSLRGRYIKSGDLPSWKILAMLAAPAILLFAPVLFFGKIFFDGDAVNLFYPYASFFSRHLSDTWNSYLFSGFPNVSTVTYGFFNPLSYVVYQVFDFLVGYHLMLAADFFGSAIFTYWLCREMKLSQRASLLAALAYTLNQWNTHWSSNILLANAIMVLPALFLGVEKIINGNRKYFILLAGAVGFGLLAAHTQFIVIALLAAGFFALYRLINLYPNRKKIIKSLIWLIVGSGIGLGFSLPQIMNSRIFAALSTRSQGVDYGQAIDSAAAMPLDFLKYILPHFSLRSLTAPEFLPYLGVIPFLLALAAIWNLWKKDASVKFLTIVFGITLLISLKYSPVFKLMLHIPVIKYFRGPARWLFVGNFALAILSGFGFDYFYTGGTRLKNILPRIALWICKIVIAGALVVNVLYRLFGQNIIVFVQHYFDSHLYSRTTHLPLEYYHQLIASIAENSFSNVSFLDSRFLVSFFFLIAGTWALAAFCRNPGRGGRWLLIVAALNLIAVFHVNTSFADSALIKQTPEFASIIKTREKNDANYRVFSFLVNNSASQNITATHSGHSTDGFKYTLDGLNVNTNLLWDIPAVDGSDTIANRRGQRILAEIGTESGYSFDSLANKQISLADKINLFETRLPLLSMLNVKYIISGYELPALQQLSLLKKNSEGPFATPLYLYVNAGVLPRVYFANTAIFLPVSAEDRNFQTIVQSSIGFSNQSFIECDDCSEGGSVSGTDTSTIVHYQNGFIAVRTHAARDRWLIISESNLPSWQATIDGVPAFIYTANYVFQALHIPSGDHLIELRYAAPFSLNKAQ